MAVTPTTLRLLDSLSTHVDTVLEQVDRAVVEAWARAYDEVAAEWEAALADLTAASQDGAWPSRRQVRRARRAQEALEVTVRSVEAVAAELGLSVSRSLSTLVPDGAEWELRLLASQLPPDRTGGAAAVLARLERVDPDQLAAIVARTMAAVTKDAAVLPGFVSSTIQSVLVRGVAVGDSPRVAAAEMLRRLRAVFDLGRTRALVIARTELLDAYRAASQAADGANRKVLAGWQWCATLDPRTCIGCLSMHGREFPISQPGPQGHQQCRCARLPVAKSWTDLGFDGVDEPDDTFPDAQAWFDTLPPATQERIAGAARLAAYLDGKASWEDLVTKRSNPGWRDSWVPTPVKTLVR